MVGGGPSIGPTPTPAPPRPRLLMRPLHRIGALASAHPLPTAAHARRGPRWPIHTTPLALRRAYPVPRRHGAPDFDLQYCDNALQYARSEHIIVISAMSSI